MYGIAVHLILHSGFVLVAFGVAISGQWASYRMNLGLLPRAVRLRSFWLELISCVQLSVSLPASSCPSQFHSRSRQPWYFPSNRMRLGGLPRTVFGTFLLVPSFAWFCSSALMCCLPHQPPMVALVVPQQLQSFVVRLCRCFVALRTSSQSGLMWCSCMPLSAAQQWFFCTVV